MLLRDDLQRRNLAGIALVFVAGILAAGLVLAGNPGNMGICGACFLRDAAGTLGLISSPDQRLDPKFSYFRPEIAGVMIGALAAAFARRSFLSRSGSHAASRFVLGLWMSVGALVFLGCPFRMLQRLGGGDGNALVGLAGFIVGVFVALGFERRGYSIGKTVAAPAPVGLHAIVLVLLLGVLFGAGGMLLGPAAGASGPPPHASWLVSLGVAALAGILLSSTGFCAVSAARQIFQPKKAMLLAAIALIAGYALTVLLGGKFRASFDNQPVAHQDWFWNFTSMLLVGLTGALAGGCPVRQMVMAGEGNGDAFVVLAGLVAGGAISHNLGLASTAAGPTSAGKVAIAVGLGYVAAYAVAATPARRA